MRRGTPDLITSDNAKSLKLTNNLLYRLDSDRHVVLPLQFKRINWRFNLERSHQWWGGGHFGRLVDSVKNPGKC